MLPKLPKHVGRNRHYHVYKIHIWRQGPARLTEVIPGVTKRVRPAPEYMGLVGPIYARDKQELHDFERQIAYANRHMFGCDWTFKAIDCGIDFRKTLEDLGKKKDGSSNNLLPENDPERMQ